jgi:hypothetical protein
VGCLLSAGCGDDPVEPEVTAESLTADGWGFFARGEFVSAEGKFGEALGIDSTYADAWNGMGWSRAYRHLLIEAAASLEAANSFGLGTADAWAGLAAVYRDAGDPPDLSLSLAAADSALARDPLFVFPHRTGVDSLDLHLLRAQVLVAMGGTRLAEAQAEADFLRPENDLDPADPETWEIEGEVYSAYFEALFRLLEIIEESVGGDLP